MIDISLNPKLKSPVVKYFLFDIEKFLRSLYVKDSSFYSLADRILCYESFYA